MESTFRELSVTNTSKKSNITRKLAQIRMYCSRQIGKYRNANKVSDVNGS